MEVGIGWHLDGTVNPRELCSIQSASTNLNKGVYIMYMSKTYRSAIDMWVNQTLFGDWGKSKHVDEKDPRGKESNKSMKKPKYRFGHGFYKIKKDPEANKPIISYTDDK